MSSKAPPGMWARYILFIVGSFAILMINMLIVSRFVPEPPPKPPQKAAVQQKAEKAKPAEKAALPKSDKTPELAAEAAKPEPSKAGEAEAKPEVEPEEPPQWVSLGSADPKSPYRMLITLSNRGASVERVELSGERFRDLEDRSGYMGYVAIEPTGDKETGVRVQVVGPGTPAARAGLRKGDLITAFGDQKINRLSDLKKALAQSKPKRTVALTVQRAGKPQTLSVTLTLHPLEVIRPEGADPLSYLLTMHQIDKLNLDAIQEKDAEREKTELKAEAGFKRRPTIGQELAGVNLRTGTWKLVRHTETEAVFSRKLSPWGLEITKTYRLAEVAKGARNDTTSPAYHLVFDIAIRNTGEQARKVAYQLDGPTGLPIEGYWYANKVSRSWGATGLRDVIISLDGSLPKVISATSIANDDLGTVWKDPAITYVGVDAQYFASVLIPQNQKSGETWFAEGQPLRVGPVDMEWPNTTDTSFRLISQTQELEPGDAFTHSFTIFTGPKKPALLAHYGLKELVYYGWFWWVAVPMTWILHAFYTVVGNYGIAIILLTVVVRLGMFPLSRKQAASAQKMQELQPEIKRIAEKFKNNPEQRMKAQQELFKKHNYNPAGGCLIVFLQLPIFVGLYNALRVDVALRQAPLISESVRWCSNLAAPDMLFNWSGFMPEFVTQGHGFLGLGPYFNLLPLLTVVLFLWQQKAMMPPPADEQAAIQQNVMKFMMVFIGLMFFKVASGLCLYFVASSIWSVAERKFLPKTNPQANGSAGNAPSPKPSPSASARNNGARDDAARKRRSRKK